MEVEVLAMSHDQSHKKAYCLGLTSNDTSFQIDWRRYDENPAWVTDLTIRFWWLQQYYAEGYGEYIYSYLGLSAIVDPASVHRLHLNLFTAKAPR